MFQVKFRKFLQWEIETHSKLIRANNNIKEDFGLDN